MSASPVAGAQLRVELARKSIHLASSAIPLAYAAGLARGRLLAALAVLGVVALVVELARFRSTRARALFERAVGTLLREHEHRGWSGASWLLAAYTLSVLLFPRRIAVAAMLAAGLGDASAAIVGRTAAMVRARRALGGRAADAPAARGKTVVGSVACAVVTLVAALLAAKLSLAASVAAAVAASVAERWPTSRRVPIDDNVRVALAAGGAALLVSSFVTSVMRALS